MTEKSILSNLSHIAVVVNNADDAVKHYESLGMGPFKSREQPTTFLQRRVRGKLIDPDSLKFKLKYGKMGPVTLQVCEVLRGECSEKDFLEAKGEGVHHICFRVDDIEDTEAMLVAQGLKVIYSGRFSEGGGAIQVDTGGIGSFVLEFSTKTAVV